MKAKTLSVNKRARYDYQIVDEYVAGLVLAGHEVKSIRNGNIDIKNAFITIRRGEAWLTNAHIKQYEFARSLKDYDATRPRKLLLSKRELAKLIAAKQNKLTIIPLRVMASGSYIKIHIATARGKKAHDKRAGIAKKDADMDIKRALKSRK